MPNCLYCYTALEKGQINYHPKCIKAFFGTDQAPALPYQLSDMEQLARDAALLSISVPGVQPKLSLGWIKEALKNGHRGRLTIVDALEGQYILKPPQADYPQMPENEHLSMKLAELFRISIVPVNMIRLQSGELCFLSKRIDRNANGSKNHMIDFLQILELENKYKGTMETLGKTIGDLSAHTVFDKLRFFESAVFNYIIGNNDMHLKNYSMFLSDSGWVLSPFYDLLNVKLVLPKDKEETALLLGGKKMNFSRRTFDDFGGVLKLNAKQINGVYRRLQKWLPAAGDLIDASFLDLDRQKGYKELIAKRVAVLVNPT
jgi:serine/threonine-protein kinase HipA